MRVKNRIYYENYKYCGVILLKIFHTYLSFIIREIIMRSEARVRGIILRPLHFPTQLNYNYSLYVRFSY